MGNLDDSLKKHAKRLGIEHQVEAVGVVEAATNEISKFIPREDFEVISFKDGVLKVGTNSSSTSGDVRLRLSVDFISKNGIKRMVFVDKSFGQ